MSSWGSELVEPETSPAGFAVRCSTSTASATFSSTCAARDLEAAGLDDASALLIEGVARSVRARCVATYAQVEPGEYGTVIDPRGWLTVIRGNPENAAEGLELQSGDPVWIGAAPAA